MIPHTHQLRAKWRKLLAIMATCYSALSATTLHAAPPEQITLFAAASLRDALSEVGTKWQAESGHSIRYSFAGSSALARHIEAGAPADLIILANDAWMDHLEAQGDIVAQSRHALLGNRLVLIAPADAPPLTPSLSQDTPAPIPMPSLTDLKTSVQEHLGQGQLGQGQLGQGRLAMALVNAVPAGIYGKAALQSLGLWDMVATQVAQTDNVRAALALVALGEAPLGIVYASDQMAEPRVQALYHFPAESHPPIIYPAALVTGNANPAAADLLAYLNSAIAKEIFLRHGFANPPQ